MMARDRPKGPKSNERFVKLNTNIKRVQNSSEEQKNQLEIHMGGTVSMAIY